MEMVPDVIYEYRLVPTPGFVYVSPSVTSVVGYTPEDHYADPDLGRRIVHPDDLEQLEAIVVAPDEGRLHLIRWRHRNGTEVITAQRIRAVRDATGAVVRLLAVCRPVTRGEPAWIVHIGPLALDLASHNATVAGRTFALTSTEQQILAMLASAGRVVSRSELVERLWGAYHSSGERAVEVHISNLRKKIDVAEASALRLVTVRGVGYRLVCIAGGTDPQPASRMNGALSGHR